jgi:NAD(P)-dependent dehydrogenase (short-subunit alcohol dehydrogenase family)
MGEWSFDLRGSTALVTGASRGIGRSLAAALDGAGARVALVARTKEALEATAEGLANEPVVVADDLLDEDAPDRVVAAADREMGRVDVLVNNSGVAGTAPALELTPDAWDRVLDLNLRSAFQLAKAAAPGMMRRGRGKIVNVGSVMSFRGDMNSAAYSASKAGLIGLTRSLAVEWARHGIQVNALCPGWIETDMVADLRADERFERRVMKAIPQHRWGKPADLEGAAIFLASSASNYMTGQAIIIDGGLSAGW